MMTREKMLKMTTKELIDFVVEVMCQRSEFVKQNNSLKCCGNCKFYDYYSCKYRLNFNEPKGLCEKWEFDDLYSQYRVRLRNGEESNEKIYE